MCSPTSGARHSAARSWQEREVNQDCSFRRQAGRRSHTTRPIHDLVAGQNDSRVGYNQCGIDWSTDNGNHWSDAAAVPPARERPQFGGRTRNPNNNTFRAIGTAHL
jgi:hypothetical protein